MSKRLRVEEMLGELRIGAAPAPELAGLHPCYAGWFIFFNRGDFYEAHDALEHLWLRETGRDWRFYKGLIQFAGAFVHLKKHREHPGHPKHAGRLRPASRLFLLARDNIAPFGPEHLDLDAAGLSDLSGSLADWIRRRGFAVNPLDRLSPPVIMPGRKVEVGALQSLSLPQ